MPTSGFKLGSLSSSIPSSVPGMGFSSRAEDGNRSTFWLPDLGGVLLAALESLIILCPLSAQTPLLRVLQSAWPWSPWLTGASSFPLSWEGASSPPLAEQREHGRPHCSVSPWPRATPSLSSAWMPPMSCFSRGPKVRGDLRGHGVRFSHPRHIPSPAWAVKATAYRAPQELRLHGELAYPLPWLRALSQHTPG